KSQMRLPWASFKRRNGAATICYNEDDTLLNSVMCVWTMGFTLLKYQAVHFLDDQCLMAIIVTFLGYERMRLVFIFLALWFPFGALALNGDKPKVIQLIKTTHSWDGKQIVYPPGQPEITGLLIEIAPGKETGWHLHPLPSFAFILEGTLEVMLKDGKIKRLQAGDPLVEVVNTPHNGRNVGTTPLKIMVFYAGAVGQKLTLEQPG
ncbi:MAG: cupin domain-containing protein, partial [Methylovulum sp.]|nr:cupin domain-containing protein [Methylovulum sp.]